MLDATLNEKSLLKNLQGKPYSQILSDGQIDKVTGDLEALYAQRNQKGLENQDIKSVQQVSNWPTEKGSYTLLRGYFIM